VLPGAAFVGVLALTVPDAAVDSFLEAIDAVVERMRRSPSFWTEALRMARRVLHII
jgi:hypothetical protein